MLPDIISDNAIKAAHAMGCQFMESFFFRAALEAGFREEPHRHDAEDEAQKLMKIWARQGFDALPTYVKHYAVVRSRPMQKLFSTVPVTKKAG